ncbi:DNA repair protein RAD2, putative [Plasmodium berghei]|uniref:DNA repair protein RAD2, putative n=2 Tax=Plasmodium berghei TaxID=5821 RepID=A0A509AFL4_PLABA|nr:DNA repair protein RAD2, putative [Plasmodium berghei ANKA]SCL90708.1 DNA repair protein RAD2, putative [Plasmodium berghei]SCM15337.1 DNA repair protein RAD2, putative [Plasmodium berghei]SCN22126.1 DNA repair protein RAD2, putative [Plasmodium berghei]VUC54076.1 DNA repair protein RAD2, putative [Plasmodium berghei ANKA]|eukprot:XP_034419921.1 DNA repair protein RAD2, putative [Plasmodium berghei ANKA]
MGVKGLWSIVAPIGVRVNPEIFTGKRIAIDVSIWLYELIYGNNLKSSRNNNLDDLGMFNDLWLDFSENNSDLKLSNLKKGHIYFFFLRICKLLYYNIRPIFIFDGIPPELKKRTIFQRNLKRKNNEEKVKKTAEKLIYNYYNKCLLKFLKKKKEKKNGIKLLEQKKELSNGKDNDNNPDLVENGKDKKENTDSLNYELDKLGINNLIEIYENIKENNESLNKISEHVGSVNITAKEVFNICNNNSDDLNKIKNNFFIINDEDIYNEKNSKISEEIYKLEKNKQVIKNDSKLQTNNFEIDTNNDIVDDIFMTKNMIRKKYYAGIPEDFKGFLSMRRTIDIIDINNYNINIDEVTKKMKEAEKKYSNKCDKNVFSNISTEILLNNGEVEMENVENVENGENEVIVMNYIKSENKINSKEINVLEMPVNNLFVDGKDEYKVYYVNNEEIKIPLFKEINKEVFEKLPVKLQYRILQDIKEEWYADNRLKAIKSKDDMDIFSQVQIETYIRMIKTDFEIEKLKIKMAENIQNEKLDGELIINTNLSKKFNENLNARNYNDIKDNITKRPKKKRGKESFLNKILGGTGIQNFDGVFEIEEDEEFPEMESISKEVEMGEISDVNTVDARSEEFEKVEATKLLNDYKESLLINDKDLFGDDFFAIENEEIGNVGRNDGGIKHKDNKIDEQEAESISKRVQDGITEDSFFVIEETELKSDEFVNFEMNKLDETNNKNTEIERSNQYKEIIIDDNDDSENAKGHSNSLIVTPSEPAIDVSLSESSSSSFESIAHGNEPLNSLSDDDVIVLPIKKDSVKEVDIKEVDIKEVDVKEVDVKEVDVKDAGHSQKFLTKEIMNNILIKKKIDFKNGGEGDLLENFLNNKEVLDAFGESRVIENDDVIQGLEGISEDMDKETIDKQLNENQKKGEELMKEYKKLKNNNITINEEMNEDIKLLLDFFGIPYIQAPCEAEAQCSYLNNNNYCDAIISDDSDVIVFSGKTIIKNFFNKKKTVEVYEKNLIERKLGLYQDDLINISMLCGCDYTVGVHGVGIVNALEIVKAFPTFDDLKILKEIVSNPLRDIYQENDENNYSDEIKKFLNTHRNYKLNWIFPKNFPDKEVYKCFKYPKVCKDIKKIEWHAPNMNKIIHYLNKTTNISEDKIFNVLDPILKKYNVKTRSYQLRIEDFFPVIEKKRKSVDDLINTIRSKKKETTPKKATPKKKVTTQKKTSKENGDDNSEWSENSLHQLDVVNEMTNLIDANPSGIVISKRMSNALKHIKKRKDTIKNSAPKKGARKGV